MGGTHMQCALHPQDERQGEIAEVVIDGRPETRDNEVVRRHVMQESLQQGHMEKMILSGGPVKHELAVGEPAASPVQRSNGQGRDTPGYNDLITFLRPARPL